MYRKLIHFTLIFSKKLLGCLFGWVPLLQRRIAVRIRRHQVYQFKSRPSDVFIVSYPKSGTTWMQSILYQLTTDGDLDRIEHILKFSPHLEEDLITANKISSPRILKSHVKPRDIKINTSAKYIYILRDGLDVAVSYFDHVKALSNDDRSFEKFYSDFINGAVPYGSWFDHVNEWMSEKFRKNILFVRYEDLKSDTSNQIIKISKFLNIAHKDDELKRILDRISFDYMKKNEDKFCLKRYKISKLVGQNNLINKGEIGRGRNISEKQKGVFEEKARRLHLGASCVGNPLDNNWVQK